MFRRVLILSASAGNGHVKAAQALERQIRIDYPDAEVKHVDALKYCTKLVEKMYSKGYIHLVNKLPEVLGYLYDSLDEPWSGETSRSAWHRANTRKLVRLIRDFDPDMVVNTHFLGSEIVSRLICKGKLNCANTVVVTDFDAHSMWLCRHYDRYFVALEETKRHLAALGIEEDKISVTGIPIDPVFAETKDKAAMRAHYGLDPARPTVLVSAGGFGVGPMDKLLEQLMQVEHPAQYVMLCGKNEELKARMDAMAASAPANIRLLPVAYTNEVDQYMSAADVIVGKPGGLTTSEALAKGLAFAIFKPIPGQEERNTAHLLESGAATMLNNMPTIGWKLDGILASAEKIAEMQAAARRLSRPHSARDIVAELAAMPASYGGTFYAPGHQCLGRE